jgi:xanthine dehydrogenase FAD-binding subunit
MFDVLKYYDANSVEEAIQLLQKNPKAKLICGGTDVLIRCHGRQLPDAELISIKQIKEINGVSKEANGTIVIGAATPFSHITDDPIIKKHLPFLGEAVDMVGGPQIRNMGTIGGNVCNGATSADSAPTLFALNAQLKIKGLNGERIVDIQDFYIGPGKVNLSHDEILVGILITPDNYEGYVGHYIKYAMRNAMDIATLGTVVIQKVKGNIIEDFRLAFGVAGPTPMRCPKTEAAVIGQKYSDNLLDTISNTAITEVNPRSSWRASKDFRIQIIKENSKRACKEAYVKAGGVL